MKNLYDSMQQMIYISLSLILFLSIYMAPHINLIYGDINKYR